MVRFKNRYITALLKWDKNTSVPHVTPKYLSDALLESISCNFGEHGLGVVLDSLQVKFYCEHLGLIVVRVCRDFVKECHAALNFISSLKETSVSITVLATSGSIMSCRKSSLKIYDFLEQSSVVRMKSTEKTEEQEVDSNRAFLANLRQ